MTCTFRILDGRVPGAAALEHRGAQQHVKEWCQEQTEERHADHSGEHGDTDGVAHLRTCPRRKHQRHDAHDEGNRRRAASSAAATGSTPVFSRSLANSTIRIAFLLARPTSTNSAICVKMLLSPPVSHRPAIAENSAIGTIA